MGTELDVLFYCDRDNLRDQLWGTISWHFQTVIHPAQTSEELPELSENIHPDLLIVHSPTARRQPLSSHSWNKVMENARFLILLGERLSSIPLPDLPSMDLSEEPGHQEMIGSIQEAARQLGYIVNEGKIQERLVRRQLRIRLVVDPENDEWIGKTTGVNLNGLGARIRHVNGTRNAREHLREHTCEVHFEESDLSLTEAYGNINRVEESWEDDYEWFVAVEFKPDRGFTADPDSKQTIKDLIARQEDRSIATPGMENWL